jgi:carbon-monoxide dehydrogenase iron sulfur subunit
MRIWMNPNECRGCLNCELACSYHHSKHSFFNPELSSTKVIRNNDNAEITMSIDNSCDLCINEDAPLCVKHCVFDARGVERF